jgi:hypothetical protein
LVIVIFRRLLMKLRAIVLVAAAVGATASFAAPTPQNTTPSSGTTAAKSLDPNEVICEKQEVLGSRLAAKRVCMTRSQWADAKSQDRQDIERAQMQRGDMAPK